MGEGRRLSLNSRDDLCYLEAVVDRAGRLMDRNDGLDALTDFWRDVLHGLIDIAKEAADRRPTEPTFRPEHFEFPTNPTEEQ